MAWGFWGPQASSRVFEFSIFLQIWNTFPLSEQAHKWDSAWDPKAVAQGEAH